MVESMTLTAIEDGRTVRSVTLDNAQWQRVVDATTGEVLTPTRTLVRPGDPDERYPVPEDARFIDGETADFIDAPDLEAIAEALIESRPPLAHIERFTVAFLWKRVGGSEGGKARVAALIAAGEGLWQYTDHMPSCALNHRYDDPEVDPDAVTCDCGYRESNRTWKRAKEERDG